MNSFIDTSAFLATLNANDRFHQAARQTWQEILDTDGLLFSSNYVILETIAVLQHRFGAHAVQLFESDLAPVIEIIWIDETLHKIGVSAVLAANRRHLSLVDCTSFEVIRQFHIDRVFTFDPLFREQGFTVIPEGQ